MGDRAGTLEPMAADFMRIGDAERDEAVGMLSEHHANGRLSSEEFDDRMSRAFAARTLNELTELFHDLPSPRPGSPFVPQPSPSPTPYGYDTPAPAYGYDQPGYDSAPEPYGYDGAVTPYEDQPPGIQAAKPDRPWYAQWWMMIIAVVVAGAFDIGSVAIVLMAVWLWVIYPSMVKNKQRAVPPATPPRPLTYMEREYVMDEVRAGRKINAIKRYRELTGAGLVVAKNTVESWSRQIGR